ncbi:MAG TPA: virulence factor [Methylomirabilota bacterium]|nr:virulence factor [Methylomirabilota bacterium]
MATYQIIAWRGIPASVETRDGADTVTRQLSERFQMLIDSAAMQLGLQESDAYIEQWTRSAPSDRPGSATDVADAVVAELEQRFPEFIGQAFRH